MDKNKKKTIVELGKDALIVLLTCSALWLASRGRIVVQAPDETGQFRPTESQTVEKMETVRPLRLVANGVGGTSSSRCLLQYGTEDSDAVFQQASKLLTEALAAADKWEEISRQDWEEALTDRPSLYFDFQGEIPVEILSDQYPENLSTARRLVLSQGESGMELCLRDEEEGTYYSYQVGTVNLVRLEELLASLVEDGTFYAFESSWGSDMDPDTLLHTEPPTPMEYLVSNPVTGGKEMLEELMGVLGFSVSTSNFYTSGGEQVARNGNNMLRLSDRGTLHYEADMEGNSHFSLQTSRNLKYDLTQYVNSSRRIINAVMTGRIGQARLYLDKVEERENGVLVTFAYSLDGIPVRLKEGPAASFLFREEHMVEFDLCLRNYTPSEKMCLVMPPRQAAAALDALKLGERELMLVYHDSGAETVTAEWVADCRNTERK